MNAEFLLLYVESVAKSRTFYADLLSSQPVEESENFALFALPSGLKLGLWKRDEVKPQANLPGGFEIGLAVENSETVDRLAAEWNERGIRIVQQPEDMDFGRTFTALDLDGHRLRVFHPGQP